MGYNPDFIAGHKVPLPTPGRRLLTNAFGGGFIDHTRHSLLFNESRGLAYVTAHNVDGALLPGTQLTSRNFKFDPEIDEDLQIGNEQGYKDVPDLYQRGHLARRASLSWGSTDSEIEAAKQAERESDYYSNIAPQDRRMHVAWGKVEDWMLERAKSQNSGQRACVFQGPVFSEDDPEITMTEGFDPVKIPAGYWKIMAISRGGILRAAGFLIWQRDYASPEPLSFDPVLEQVRLTTIEVLSGLQFQNLRQADAMIYSTEIGDAWSTSHEENTSMFGRMRQMTKTSMPGWAKSMFRQTNSARPSYISGPDDIII